MESSLYIVSFFRKSLVERIVDDAKIKLMQGRAELEANVFIISDHKQSFLIMRYCELSMSCSRIAARKSVKEAKWFFHRCADFERKVRLAASNHAGGRKLEGGITRLSETVVESEDDEPVAADVVEVEDEDAMTRELMPNNFIAPPLAAACEEGCQLSLRNDITIKPRESSLFFLFRKSLAVERIIDNAKIKLMLGRTELEANISSIAVDERLFLVTRYKVLSSSCSRIASRKSFKEAKMFYDLCAAFHEDVLNVTLSDLESDTFTIMSQTKTLVDFDSVDEPVAGDSVVEVEGELAATEPMVPNNVIAPLAPATCEEVSQLSLPNDSTIKNFYNLPNATTNDVQRSVSCRF